MSYQGRRRAPRKRLLDRILDWWYGEKEERELTDDHGNHIGGDLPPVQRWPQPERPLIRTAEIDGVHLPNLGHDEPLPYNPAWTPCWARPDVPRRGPAPRSAPGYRHLSMFDIVPVRSPWPPRTWPPILSGPRIRPELRAALLAGAA